MSARLTFDPLFATQRPFFFYASIFAMNSCCHVVLRCLGFQARPEFSIQGVGNNGQTIYHRRPKKGTANSNNNSSSSDPNSNSNTVSRAVPVVFVHGIGIGFTHYLGVILGLPTEVTHMICVLMFLLKLQLDECD